TMAQEVDPAIIGINNRDLKTFNVDVAVTGQLAATIDRPNVLLISESGFKTKADVERVKGFGAKGILVGETAMRSQNLEETFDDLSVSL
ncbi:indole-3-glycerol-phosphate synthase TrpC, partial [Escherichia coli]|nr:indole-3-glycerol-phosphate synthase TrpC [Escherichia coli]